MLRSAAVARINQGIGFRAAGNALEANIILMLQEAQRDLEKGKTLPKFLLQEEQPLILLEGSPAVNLPTGFLRLGDDLGIVAYGYGGVTTRLRPLIYIDLIDAYWASDDVVPGLPVAYSIRKDNIVFSSYADQDYTFYWDYYKAADPLTSDIENAWLANAPEWLIGEAGWRLAMDLGNADAVLKFDQMRKAGNRAIIGEEIAGELAAGPYRMGANL